MILHADFWTGIYLFIPGIINENRNTPSINLVNLIRTHHMTAESCPTPHPPSYHFGNPNLFLQWLQERNARKDTKPHSLQVLHGYPSRSTMAIPDVLYVATCTSSSLIPRLCRGGAWVQGYTSWSFIALFPNKS